MGACVLAHPFDVWALNPFDWRHFGVFFPEPRNGAASLGAFGNDVAPRRSPRAPLTEFPRNWRVMMTARYGGRLAAIGATALLTAAVFVLPAKAETDAKAVI